jgi:hypothetical protein
MVGASIFADHVGKQSVYFSPKPDDYPIIIDTGASMSITPCMDDFLGKIDPSPVTELHGLNTTTKVYGIGTVSWSVRDVFGVIRTIKTKAYYVPDATIRLFSPQTYFRSVASGSLLVHANSTHLTVPDGTSLQFPYHPCSNLPYMLTGPQLNVGLTYEDTVTLTTPEVGTYMSVAAEANQNITATQKELLKWHWRLGHLHFSWLQRLTATSRNPDRPELPVLSTKYSKISTCAPPLCAACHLGKLNRRGTTSTVEIARPEREMLLRQDQVLPGDMVSVDQYVSTMLGRRPHTKGKEPPNERFVGGTLFVDHATSYVFARHQLSLRAGDTVLSKQAFERDALTMGRLVKTYRADNVPFGSQEFLADLELNNQNISFSGTGAHHQNGVAERAIGTITRWARTMLLHAVIHWPDCIDLALWPFAVDYAVYLWNNLPQKDSLYAPIELFSGSKFPSYDHLHRTHVWGCPVYVLDPKLQDGHKLPKWTPRARRGQFLGVSPNHSSTVGRILNHQTGHVSPQFHCIYDDLFSTVPNADHGGILDLESFQADQWAELVASGSERLNADDPDEVPPELPDEWLTPDELDARNHQRAHRQRLRSTLLPLGPVTAPEGDGPDNGPDDGPDGGPVPEPNQDPLVEPPDDPHDAPEDPNGPDTEPIAQPQQVPNNGPVVTRSGRQVKPNKKFQGEQWQNLQSQKIKMGTLNRQFINTLSWDRTRSMSRTLGQVWALMNRETDPDTDTVEYMPPTILATQANAEDNPSWEQAMSGPERAGYWKACETELNTLKEEKDAWDVVDREPWMNVLPSTWAFKCKRYPDGTVRKLKARFCVRGDRQIEGVDYFETFAPVVAWVTVRLMLILSVILNLATTQVDYTAAFVHADIDRDPNWDTMTEQERDRAGVYIEMPRGFKEEGKVLKLKKSLYGLKQSPRNFFLHLKQKLHSIGFQTNEEVDPCLFVSDKVVCLVYVDDTLFYSSRQEYIDEVIQRLRNAEMDLEVEGTVAGFLGVHIDRNATDGTVTLSQMGLVKRVVEALDIGQQPIKHTPATAEPLVKDTDGEPPNGTYSYASVIGMLQYLHSHSRPDITFAVSQCARFVHNTRRSHEIALEHIGQYLKGTMDRGLVLKPTEALKIDCFVDADFAGLWPYEDKQDPTCVKSRTGFVICLADCPVIWSSKLQTEIATSTMEAEYSALSTAMRDLLPFKHLVETVVKTMNFGRVESITFQTTVWEDNAGALTLANLDPGRMTPRSKHYAVKYHWFRSHLKPNNIKVMKIETNKQKADILTKGLRATKFVEIRKLLCGW